MLLGLQELKKNERRKRMRTVLHHEKYFVKSIPGVPYKRKESKGVCEAVQEVVTVSRSVVCG